MLNISENSLEKYERGVTKIVPPDKVAAMVKVYNAPELKNLYCKTVCPLGCDDPVCLHETTVEKATIHVLHSLDPARIAGAAAELLGIAADGEITSNEAAELLSIEESFQRMMLAISEFMVLARRTKAVWS